MVQQKERLSGMPSAAALHPWRVEIRHGDAYPMFQHFGDGVRGVWSSKSPSAVYQV